MAMFTVRVRFNTKKIEIESQVKYVTESQASSYLSFPPTHVLHVLTSQAI